MNEKGNLSINSENFLPIIKKWQFLANVTERLYHKLHTA